MRKRPVPGIFALMFLTACSVTEPVVVVGNGSILRGSATAGLSGGTYNVTDGKLTCAGNYDDTTMSRIITFPTICSDGRTGTVVANRDPSLMSGIGKVRLSDGSEWDFMFGDAASAFGAPPRQP